MCALRRSVIRWCNIHQNWLMQCIRILNICNKMKYGKHDLDINILHKKNHLNKMHKKRSHTNMFECVRLSCILCI